VKTGRARHRESQIDLFAIKSARDDAAHAPHALAVDRIDLVVGDLSAETADAIVSPANGSLAPGDVVERSIRRAAGRGLEVALAHIRVRDGGCRTGHVVVTDGFRTRARHIIHAVGPRYRGGAQDEDALLARVYREALAAARTVGAQTVAFPPLSTGMLAFPHGRAAPIALATVVECVEEDLLTLATVRFVFQDGDACEAWSRARDSLRAGAER
jgi:O-acetyl-ADP-ribose deacetylase (regulator of RNase III)